MTNTLEVWICPVCGAYKEINEETHSCPWCGASFKKPAADAVYKNPDDEIKSFDAHVYAIGMAYDNHDDKILVREHSLEEIEGFKSLNEYLAITGGMAVAVISIMMVLLSYVKEYPYMVIMLMTTLVGMTGYVRQLFIQRRKDQTRSVFTPMGEWHIE